MRLIADQLEEHDARFLTRFMTQQGIYNLCERISPRVALQPASYRLWVEREEQVQQAKQWVLEFQSDAKAFQQQHPAAEHDLVRHDVVELSSATKEIEKTTMPRPLYFGPLMMRLLVICCGFYLLNIGNTLQLDATKHERPLVSAIERPLLYDYPSVMVLYEQHLSTMAQHPAASGGEGNQQMQPLLEKVQQTPQWETMYAVAFQLLQKGQMSWSSFWSALSWDASFEKIKQGQVWRLVTPSLMHQSLVHLVFNLLWLIVLGGQIEERISRRRLLLLLLLLAAFSNTCQYLVTGWHFNGLSGVIAGLAAFIWMRQHRAPNEGYPLDRSVLYYIGSFILIGCLWECYTFFGALHGWPTFPLGIGNTAHVSGAGAGFALASLPFFRRTLFPSLGDLSQRSSSDKRERLDS